MVPIHCDGEIIFVIFFVKNLKELIFFNLRYHVVIKINLFNKGKIN